MLKPILFMITFIPLLLILGTAIYLQHPYFGKAPSGERLARMQRSPHYKDGAFVNLSYTPTLSEGYSMTGVLYNFLFNRIVDAQPAADLPSVRTDLMKLPTDSNVLVWFGHSSYYLQADGLKFLVDPVFSGSVSPVPGSATAFKGTNNYTVRDIPQLDYLLITHDHFDHLDYETVKALKDKVGKVICGLGVGAHLEYWGYPAEQIIERDWNETIPLEKGAQLYTVPARHFSGRTFRRNNTLWLSFVLETPKRKIFIGGDSGYDSHFAAIGRQFGPIDLAIIENGQYNIAWQAIHCLPEETVKAAQDLQARRLLPVHNSKFALSLHTWQEPLEELCRYRTGHDLDLITPMIGEPVHLDDSTQVFQQWWKTQ